MASRTVAVVGPLRNPARCWFYDGGFQCRNDAVATVYYDEMVSEDIPAQYPPGSERQARRSTTLACEHHAAIATEETVPRGE